MKLLKTQQPSAFHLQQFSFLAVQNDTVNVIDWHILFITVKPTLSLLFASRLANKNKEEKFPCEGGRDGNVCD